MKDDMLMSNILTWVLITQICSVNALFLNKKVFKFWKKIDLFTTNKVQCCYYVI